MKAGKIKISYNAPVTLTFILISWLVLICNSLTRGWLTSHLFSVYRSSALEPLTYIRMFGHVLGHADFNHFIGNAIPILVLGSGLEEKYGSASLLSAIFIAALTSGLIWFVFFPGQALLGASGIVFLMIMLSTFGNVKDGSIPLTTILIFVLYVGNEFRNALFASDNIAQTAHIVGALCGTALGFLLNRKKVS